MRSRSREVRRVMPAVFAGTIFASSTYIAIHLLGHFNLVHAWVIPLAVLAWIRSVEHQSPPTLRRHCRGVRSSDVQRLLLPCLLRDVRDRLVDPGAMAGRDRRAQVSAGRTSAGRSGLPGEHSDRGHSRDRGVQDRAGGHPESRRRTSEIHSPHSGSCFWPGWLCDAESRVTKNRIELEDTSGLALAAGWSRALSADHPASRHRGDSDFQFGRIRVATTTLANRVTRDRPGDDGAGKSAPSVVRQPDAEPCTRAWESMSWNRSRGLELSRSRSCCRDSGLRPSSDRWRRWIWLTGLFFVWSLGSFLLVGGIDTGLPLPQLLGRMTPILSNARMPGRAIVMVQLGIALLCAAQIAHRKMESTRSSQC